MKVIQYGDNNLYFENSDDYECLKITEKEEISLEEYKRTGYILINNILEDGLDNSLIEEDNEMIWDFGYNNIKDELNNICDVYSIMYKTAKAESVNSNIGMKVLYRGTINSDIKNIAEGKTVNKFISTTTNQKLAQNYFSTKWKEPAYIEIIIQNDVPFVNVSSVLDEDFWEIDAKEEIILAPFLNVEKKVYNGYSEVENSFGKVRQEKYILKVGKQNLEELSDENEKKLEEEVINEAGKNSVDFSYLLYLKDENEKLKIKSENLTKKMLKIQNKEKIDKIDNEIKAINEKIQENKNTINKLTNEIEKWKYKIKILCMSKFKKIEKNIDNEFIKENNLVKNKIEYKREKFQFDKNEKSFKENIKNIQTKQNFIYDKCKNIVKIQQEADEIAYRLKINYYKYLENPEKLDVIIENYYKNIGKWLINKLNEYSVSPLENSIISKSDIEDLKNKYENNLKLNQNLKMVSYKTSDIFNITDLKDFDNFEEMQLNALKKGIFDKFELIKANIHYEQLNEEYKKILQKNIFKKVADAFSGNNSVDNEKKKKIKEVMNGVQNKIKDIKSIKEPDKNREYDLEKLVAKMEIFCVEGLCDVEFSNKYLIQIQQVQKLFRGVRKFFDIDNEKVKKLKEEYKNSKLPMVVEQEKNGLYKGRKNKKENKLKEFNNNKNEFILENEYLDISEVKPKMVTNNSFCIANRMQLQLNQICEFMKDINMYIGETNIESENEIDCIENVL